MSSRNMHKKATFEDKFYRNWCAGKENHNSGWAKDKKRNRKNLRRFLKNELRGETDEELS